MRRFLDAAEETGYDVERLQGRFGASFEQVCHRLSTMQRAGRAGIPFYFVKTDIAGNILKRSSATRFRFSQFGGPCPLWNVYKTFSEPGQIQIQVARTPDDTTYLNIARTVGRGGGYYLARPRSVAVVLGCEIEHATRTVYATGLDLANTAAGRPDRTRLPRLRTDELSPSRDAADRSPARCRHRRTRRGALSCQGLSRARRFRPPTPYRLSPHRKLPPLAAATRSSAPAFVGSRHRGPSCGCVTDLLTISSNMRSLQAARSPAPPICHHDGFRTRLTVLTSHHAKINRVCDVRCRRRAQGRGC